MVDQLKAVRCHSTPKEESLVRTWTLEILGWEKLYKKTTAMSSSDSMAATTNRSSLHSDSTQTLFLSAREDEPSQDGQPLNQSHGQVANSHVLVEMLWRSSSPMRKLLSIYVRMLDIPNHWELEDNVASRRGGRLGGC